ncbi:hypothetical protein F8M41_022979 [Gigaspora margarita]|uniref:Uncharacterized protein n=1 Tax=Gigaspora margarita TaxID=4874 RepID=A0A8H4B102_GIGMA|nr:hypothetical protein F8M41_022979 [Gigaspora margarita]
MIMNVKWFITILIIATLCKPGYNYDLCKYFIKFTKVSTLNINYDNNNQELNANFPLFTTTITIISITKPQPTTYPPTYPPTHTFPQPQPTHDEPEMNMSDYFRYDMKKGENYSEIVIKLSGNIDIGDVTFNRSKDMYTIDIPFTRL